MRVLRWLLVGIVYLAVELGTPLGATAFEAFDGEAEETVALAGYHRSRRLAAAARGAAPAPKDPRLQRAAPPRVAARAARLVGGGAPRRVPPALAEPSPPSGSEDH
jgi:hypothetical protein